jgi:DNA recombination protein RmuC
METSVLLLLLAGAFAGGFVLGRRRAPGTGALTDARRAVLEAERARANAELDGRTSVIDRRLATMTDELREVGALVHALDADRRESFGALATELRRQQEGLLRLDDTTRRLHESLGAAAVRGQWGERMADDVLRLAGFVEGVNYRKQLTLPDGRRPDFTFLLPDDLVLHMDVKFPLDNFARCVESTDAQARARHRDAFLRDVRGRVREVVARGYADGRDDTVDCVLLFIPNEQVYAFVQQHDPAILDDALAHKVVLCSPLTLFAVLAVVRQSIDNFRLGQTSGEILRLLGRFSQQWEKYAAALDTVQRRFQAVARDFDTLMTTRQRALQRPLDEIEVLRRAEWQVLDGEREDVRPAAGSGG